MKIKMLIGAMALTLSGSAFAAEPPAPKKDCCCKKGEDSKMASCGDKAKPSDKSGHEGHDMGNVEAK